jgi:hypothetical protein
LIVVPAHVKVEVGQQMHFQILGRIADRCHDVHNAQAGDELTYQEEERREEEGVHEMIASSSHPSELLLLSFVRDIASVKPAEESERGGGEIR